MWSDQRAGTEAGASCSPQRKPFATAQAFPTVQAPGVAFRLRYHPGMPTFDLTAANSLLLVIDVQERFLAASRLIR